MKIRFRNAAILCLCLTIIVAGNTIAQDLQPILDAVNKLDTRLKAAIEKEAQTRADEIAALRSEIRQLKSSPTGVNDSDRLGVIEARIDSLLTITATPSDVTPTVTPESLAALSAEILSLRTHVAELQSELTQENEPEVPVATADELASLGQRLDSLKLQFAETRDHEVEEPAHGDTRIHGKLYSHAVADVTDGASKSNEFAVSRAYLTFISELSRNASMRITTDFKTIDERYDVLVKYAFLNWESHFSNGTFGIRLGLQPTMYLYGMDGIWGHRYVEETILEREHILTPSDLAATVSFGIGENAKHGIFSLAVLNGTSYTQVSEENGRKDVNAVLFTQPLQSVPSLEKSAFAAQVYYGTQNESLNDLTVIDTAGPTPDTTVIEVEASDWKRTIVSLGGLLAVNSRLDLGFDVNLVTLGDGPERVNVSQRATSIFATLHLREFVSEKSKLRHLSLFARRDFYDPDTESDRDDLTATILGIESAPLAGLKIALNYRVDTFDDDNLADQKQLYVNTLFMF